MSVLDQDLGQQEQHSFLEVEGPDVYRTCVLDIIIEFLLRLEYGQEMAERVRVLD